MVVVCKQTLVLQPQLSHKPFYQAVIEGSSSIIVAHNRPTGDVTPSDGDIRTTRKLHDAGELLQIPLLDHIIFTATRKDFFSFQENKTLSSSEKQGKEGGEKL
jgi:hypothetical protein